MQRASFDPGLTQAYAGRLRRIINQDGSFNVRRFGAGVKDAGWFLHFMNLRWPMFLVEVPLIYLAVIGLFAGLYVMAGAEHLQGLSATTTAAAWLGAFFFSVQTFTTVGYGHIAPATTLTNLIAAAEAMCGILSFAVATGLVYGRFSRPSAHLRFSRHAVVAPYQDGHALMFRFANRRPNVLMEIEARVLLATVDRRAGEPRLRYRQLKLERDAIFFLPLAWTVVHPIDADSPLDGQTAADLQRDEAEVMVMVKCFDDTFSQVVHARASYRWEDIEWGTRFRYAFRADSDGSLVLDLKLLDATESIDHGERDGR
jgi:inward rectifier potassium channel